MEQQKSAEKKKDPYQEIVDILASYEDGCIPHDTTDYEM